MQVDKSMAIVRLLCCVAALTAAATRADATRVPYFEVAFTISLQEIRLYPLLEQPDWAPTETVTKDLWGLTLGGPSGTGTLTFYTPETYGTARLSVRGGSGAVSGGGSFDWGDPTRGIASSFYHVVRYRVSGSAGTLSYDTDAILRVKGVYQYDGQSHEGDGYFYPSYSYALTDVRMSSLPAQAPAPVAVTPLPAPVLLLAAGLALLTVAGRRRGTA